MRENMKDVPSSEVRGKVRHDLGGIEGTQHTVYELLLGWTCANSNGVCEEVSLVPGDLGYGIEAKRSTVDWGQRVLTGSTAYSWPTSFSSCSTEVEVIAVCGLKEKSES
jgi:hypothetical protein